MDAIADKIADLSESRVIESALALLTKEFMVDDPLKASSRVAEAIGEGRIDPASLDIAARRAASEDRKTVVEVMRLALMDAAGENAARCAEIERLIDKSGEKAPFIVDDLLIAGTICLAGYIVHKTGGKSERQREIVVEEMPDGTIKTTYRETTKYVSPFSAFGSLLKSIPGIFTHHSSPPPA